MIAYYTYEGDGLALGSVIVVAAEEEEIARPLAEAWAEGHGIASGSLRLDGVARMPQPLVVYAWNGDY